MVVQHNLTAMNSNRMLGLTTKTQAKSTEKLSSGYKVNRAADDAAGLAISEKMRKQIRGLTQASANAQDGISAVQTAEGALNEVQDMLQRMNELAVKAANGTNSESDRTAIQNEIDQLTTEIDRVAETTKFNETYLLKGDKDLAKDHTYSYKNFSAAQAGAATMSTDSATSLTATYTSGAGATQDLQDKENELLMALRDQGVKISVTTTATAADGKKYTFELNGDASQKFTVVENATAGKFDIQDKEGTTIGSLEITGDGLTAGTAGSKSATIIATSITASQKTAAQAKYYDRDGNGIPENELGNYFKATTTAAGATSVSVRADAPQLYDAVGNKTTAVAGNVGALNDLTAALSVTLHVGADATANNQITLNIDTMSAKGLGVNGLKVDGTNDSNALGAIETIKAALQKVSDQRAELGAVQNRLEHTINNLDNVVENTTSAESQIRDTDMATEMVRYSNNNILAQAGQAMLAQANQSNQGVLSLLG
ncbi:MAG: flagellar hook protein [bacterium]|nr:flagellar hook protein [bacterium]